MSITLWIWSKKLLYLKNNEEFEIPQNTVITVVENFKKTIYFKSLSRVLSYEAE